MRRKIRRSIRIRNIIIGVLIIVLIMVLNTQVKSTCNTDEYNNIVCDTTELYKTIIGRR